MLICRVEDVIVEGTITGSVVHFHWIRNIDVSYSGVISVSGLGIVISSNTLLPTESHTSPDSLHYVMMVY